ncbi:menaquinone biosynthesis prenyltransferase MqnP [Helicobacter sp. 10-6591]|uniref:menaquinone biosynthesis prenyltransferase MqnP n=1 Tax=Helicobacter sp. 10-6591 TaxID=2004998 RepID=UPI000DCB3081|nr:menaquinone biosynthesis prenyltransferase MqnP [Helicobacter sp. 10-6591]RAX55553.1 4-hydroxybenzoate polyprenyltransferase [Helicobacter sp. 10-6591]
MSLLQKLKNFNELVMFEHTIFSATFILIAMIVASLQADSKVWVGTQTLILCALALVFARNFAMGFNRLVDRKIDILNPRTKSRPSVDGRIGLVSMNIFCIANALAFILICYSINTLAFMLSLPFLLIIGGYSFLKRFSYLAHLVLGISLSLAPIAGCIAVLGNLELWCIFLSIGVMFWVAGFDLLYSLQDMEFDSTHGLHSIPSRFGARKTLYLSRIFHICAVVFWFFFIYESALLNILSYLGLFFSGCMLLYEQYLVHKDFTNIPKAFFTTNGYLGFVFLFFVLSDGVLNYGL